MVCQLTLQVLEQYCWVGGVQQLDLLDRDYILVLGVNGAQKSVTGIGSALDLENRVAPGLVYCHYVTHKYKTVRASNSRQKTRSL